MTKQKKITIWICEDDDVHWNLQEETAHEEIPNCMVKHFLSAKHAVRGSGSPDFIIMDVGAICSTGVNMMYNIEKLCSLHPGAIIIIYSGMDEYAVEIYQEIKNLVDNIVLCSPCFMISDWCDLIKQYR
jgi:DNA-binding NtrC family response regulator